MPAQLPDLNGSAAREYILQSLCSILSNPHGLDQKSYIAFNEAIHNFCMGKHTNTLPEASIHGIREDLYCKLNSSIVKHVRQTRVGIISKAGRDNGSLLKLYVAEWKRVEPTARMINHLFSIVVRNWIDGSTLPNGKVLPIYNLQLRRWKEGMLAEGPKNVFEKALQRLTTGEKATQEKAAEEIAADFITSREALDTALAREVELYPPPVEELEQWVMVERPK